MTANGERLWKWLLRACAVGGFVMLLLTKGFDAPGGAYVLITGLFFGPEIITGKLQIFTKTDDKPK